MSKPNQPTLLFPNGGEDILTRIVDIEWSEPSPASTDGLPVWYEVYFSEFYDSLDEPDWKKIATLPIGNRKFSWKVGNTLRSNQIKVAVSSVNIAGERSPLSISADTFTIKRAMPIAPAVLNPIPNARYGSRIEVVFDDNTVLNSFGQRAKYYVFFSSRKAEIPFTPIAQSVPVGAGPLVWDTSSLPPSDDYILTAYLADDDGNKSPEVNVSNLSIINEGYFLVDTKPPSGYVQINDGDEFTRARDASVKLFAFDETTGIHAMRFLEGEGDGSFEGPPESYVNIKYYQMTEEDGTKTIKVLFQDFGANRTSEIQKNFRVNFDISNGDIADMILEQTSTTESTIWIGYNGDEPALYKIEDGAGSSFITRINEPITSLGFLTGVVYIAVDTSDDTALVYRNTGVGAEAVIQLDTEGSEVLTMDTYNDMLYMGTLNGSLYRYDESAVNLVTTFDKPVERLYSDGALLYILLRNEPTMTVYDGSSFTEVNLI